MNAINTKKKKMKNLIIHEGNFNFDLNNNKRKKKLSRENNIKDKSD